ncbi:GntR family transcriptional regulator [Denitrobaculum tricleocarpae]|uniref:GntR family transcriptional regulator n=1 Tax=Denitrobaculum tricleocarpae TaxID=2591009 RepID=A0A545U1K3_9PROT|nr:GntR family transcriptional regulator [Denitrobaculum tricleocarpae]TQV83345.1 GntR family transcriptional regulator [Denitrobaculum tricleocarpae]
MAVEKMREQAYQSFTQHLLASHVRPGQFVSQRELVELTGMTLAAIRELVPRLEAEGLITTVPQRGMQIAAIDFNLVRDAYQFRVILEKEAVAHCTRTAADADLERLRCEHQNILDEALDAGVSRDLDARAQNVDWGFHDFLIDSLKNEIAIKTYRVNSLKIRLIRQELTRIEGHVVPVMKEHLEVVKAMQARDVQGAVDALVFHIEHARQRAMGLS